MFVLRISATSPAIDRIKARLTQDLPDVKSSHRVEAIGRGLGFRTYAALRAAAAAAQAPAPAVATVTGSYFSDYLKEHEFEVNPAHLYRAAAEVAIQAVLDAVPTLHVYGIGLGRPQRNADGSRQTPQQQYAEFQRHREECFGKHAAEAFLRSMALLARVTETRTIRPGAGSYRLKHIAENYVCTYPEGGKLGPAYVPNGMLIAAAVHMGFKYKTYVDDLGYDALNASFNMSKAVVDDLDAEIRPNTGFASDRARKRQSKRELVEARMLFAAVKASLPGPKIGMIYPRR
ncbi:hypothetical protein FBZ93_111251 [Bradyrhizobium macuxiense]|uniref:Uncharacterized protein n=1 Tax=Bradyrhizobium macuxiense TaxID=1755647 RepID=A0A560LD45_9BRAD|nr:hypothetical protein [Bradyrhizobium macuxiense]TWB93212.1 hypothetical protein FBZ93_111251 [Bradyrhizobium macuxiense]